MNEHLFVDSIHTLDPVGRYGSLKRILPTWLEADGPNVALGSLCEIGDAEDPLLAQVVKVDLETIALVPFSDPSQLMAGMRVRAVGNQALVPVGDAFLGRAVDALARPLDGEPPPVGIRRAPLHPAAPKPLDRCSPARPLPTGIRAIDAFLTLGEGQRTGIFAASGVGKTSLIAQLTRQIDADRTIVCLIGERGREVEQLWNAELGPSIRRRTTLVAATSDMPAAVRVRAAYQALAMACHWRAEGRKVLLILDSATRLAMAMRETGLAAGEPPTVRAYPPSVFAAIPRIVEQCGAISAGGSITALFTVLAETDDVDDPICEMMKSLLDGHLVLSRNLAERGHFPALDVPRSVSRNSHRLVTASHNASARRLMTKMADYEGSQTLIESGLYTHGTSEPLDAAIAAKPRIDAFLMQRQDEDVSFAAMLADLQRLAGGKP